MLRQSLPVLVTIVLGGQLPLVSTGALAQATPAPQATPTPKVCAANLNSLMAAVADRRGWQRYQWGLVAQPLSATTPLVNIRGQNYFLPASTNKLLTTAAALRQLGTQQRLRTSIYRDGGSDPLQPALTLVGRGDPTITPAQIQALGDRLKQQGIQRITQLTVDTGYFRGDPIPPDWEWSDLTTDYGVPVTNLIVQQNAVDLVVTPQKPGQPLSYRWRTPLAGIPWQIDNRSTTAPAATSSNLAVRAVMGKPTLILTGSLPTTSRGTTLNLAMLDPQDTWLRQLQYSLGQQQISIDRLGLSDNPALGSTEIAAIESPPIAALVQEVNRNSNNLYAEVLLRTIGRTHPNHNNSDRSTADLGLEIVSQRLREIGVDPTAYYQADGSGLSRKNNIAPLALVQTLVGMARTPEASVFKSSLAVGGSSGTLANRFRNVPGQVQAKTGSLTGITGLAGYADSSAYGSIAFSILVNNHDQAASAIRSGIDEMVALLLQVQAC
jgi:serine-type D-Ala-D-Ala carboxypeptidase/endopeptidase (penicillin-binding protein 4)